MNHYATTAIFSALESDGHRGNRTVTLDLDETLIHTIEEVNRANFASHFPEITGFNQQVISRSKESCVVYLEFDTDFDVVDIKQMLWSIYSPILFGYHTDGPMVHGQAITE